MSKDDLSKGLDQAAAQAGTVKRKGRGLGALRPTKAKAETRPVNYRLPVSLLEQLDAAAEREGVGPRQKTAFVAWLLKASLDALEDGSLTPPRRESIDL